MPKQEKLKKKLKHDLTFPQLFIKNFHFPHCGRGNVSSANKGDLNVDKTQKSGRKKKQSQEKKLSVSFFVKNIPFFGGTPNEVRCTATRVPAKFHEVTY